VVIVDTAGRLHVDEELMAELVAVRNAVKPHNVLLVLDAMTGQDAVNVAEAFSERVAFDGVVLTKLDGDARGGAALSVKAVPGKRSLALPARSRPARLPSDRWRRISMGDADAHRAAEEAEEDEQEELERGCGPAKHFDDFLKSYEMMRKINARSSGRSRS
jgi:signal recognition particle subunit SRP54